MAQDVITAAGDFTWTCPAGVTSVDVELWGSGCSGNSNGGAGGGGAYSKKTVSVSAGDYAGHVGTGSAGGAARVAGEDSYFIDTSTVLAKGAPDDGSGGQASGGVGDTKFSGGSAGSTGFPAGGGGGSSAGTAADGNNGSGRTGGIAPTGGGNGGDGASSFGGVAQSGVQPGGGGGGTIGPGTIGSGAHGKAVFTYTLPAPTVSSVSASSGPAAGGTNVTITGTGFVATPTVTFGGSSATNVVRVNATTITCTTPAHAAGAVNVVVTNPDTQSGTGTNAFTYLAAGGGPNSPGIALGLHL